MLQLPAISATVSAVTLAQAPEGEPACSLQQQVEDERRRDGEQRVARPLARERVDAVHDRDREHDEVDHRQPVDGVAPRDERGFRHDPPDDTRDAKRTADQRDEAHHECPRD